MSTNTDSNNEISNEVSNANNVIERINKIALNNNKDPGSIQLVCVSKTKPIDMIMNLYNSGYRHFGENYFQELLEKAAVLPKDIKWHFIGHLQSSKSGKIVREVENLYVLETIDSIKLANKLNTACETNNKESLNVYIQVDTSGEDTKSGADPSTGELTELVTFVKEQCPRLHIGGLMTIGAPGDLSCFEKLIACRQPVADILGVDPNSLVMSMGMSNDFEEAIARGATSVRVGSTIFGARLYKNN